MARITTARTFYDLSEALVAKALLEQHGIVVFLFDAGYVTINWPHMFAVGGLRLAVLDTELDATTAILSSKNDDEIGDDSDRCPSCRSGDVMRLKSWLGGLLGLWAAAPLLWPTRRRACRECGNRWSQNRND